MPSKTTCLAGSAVACCVAITTGHSRSHAERERASRCGNAATRKHRIHSLERIRQVSVRTLVRCHLRPDMRSMQETITQQIKTLGLHPELPDTCT
eukprot:6056693-Amphidinium_carterae.1